MNDKLFDKKLKTALDNLEAPYESATWAALEQRLDAPFAVEQPAAVDKAMFHTLERLEAPYQTSHWDMLANRMAQIARLQRRVWITKLSEAAIFLLLLMNLENFSGSGTPVHQKPALPKQPQVPHLQAEIPAFRSARGDAHLPNAVYENSLLNNSDDLATNSGLFLQNIDNQDIDNIFILNTNDLNDGTTSENLTEISPEHWATLAGFMALPVNSDQSVQRVNVAPYAVSAVPTKVPKQHRFYAATFANYDRNYVRSNGYSNASNGYGGGMAIGYRIGKWGVEAGMSYNRRKYEPKKVVEIYDGGTVNGFWGSYASTIDADIVSVPVTITRRIAQFGQTTVHATAGVTTNFAVDKRYEYGSVFYPPVSQSGPVTAPVQNPKLRQNGQGVFENGSLQGNVYASADIGLRVEQPVGRHFTAFVEPAYRQALGQKGIGPNPAKVNTFSVKAGVLAAL